MSDFVLENKVFSSIQDIRRHMPYMHDVYLGCLQSPIVNRRVHDKVKECRDRAEKSPSVQSVRSVDLYIVVSQQINGVLAVKDYIVEVTYCPVVSLPSGESPSIFFYIREEDTF